MNKTNILLIDDQDIFGRSSEVNGNVSPDVLRGEIINAQDMFLRDILGDELYFKILEDFDNNALTGIYLDMFPGITDVVIFRTIQRAMLPLTKQITNKGIQTGSSDFSQSASDSAMWTHYNRYKRDAEFYERRLFNFLKENKDDIPEYTKESDDINPRKDKNDPGAGTIKMI